MWLRVLQLKECMVSFEILCVLSYAFKMIILRRDPIDFTRQLKGPWCKRAQEPWSIDEVSSSSDFLTWWIGLWMGRYGQRKAFIHQMRWRVGAPWTLVEPRNFPYLASHMWLVWGAVSFSACKENSSRTYLKYMHSYYIYMKLNNSYCYICDIHVKLNNMHMYFSAYKSNSLCRKFGTLTKW